MTAEGAYVASALCDRSGVCIAVQHEPGCRSQMSWAALMEENEHPSWCKCSRVCGGDQ